jgi:hypothetical protein
VITDKKDNKIWGVSFAIKSTFIQSRYRKLRKKLLGPMVGVIGNSVNVDSNIVHDVQDGLIESNKELVLWNLYPKVGFKCNHV